MEKPNPQILISAYMQGIFPMAHPEEGGSIYWYAPDPRGILPIEDFHCPSRLAQTVSQEPFEIRYDTAFKQVMEECAAPRKIQKTTWISEGLIEAYSELNQLGFAHSVEAWLDDELVGGLYGVSVGGLFAGESMFYRETDASKVCLVHLVERLKERGFRLLDVQFVNDHLEQFGAIEISREDYERRLAEALEQQVQFI
ncbi:MAG: leucyl/phenylalanyl-tRNA--protein transferase [Persicimonas sp.]